jgi:hypothetical protein
MSRCSTFHPQRGSSIASSSVIRASSMALPPSGKAEPLAAQPVEIEPPDLMRRPCPSRGRLVLVVEDEALLALDLR